MSVEFCRIFDVLVLTYVGLHISTSDSAKDTFFGISCTYVGFHTSTDAKDILVGTKKRFFLGHTVILFCWQFVLLFVLRSLAFSARRLRESWPIHPVRKKERFFRLIFGRDF